jgi:uncharacterized protein (TIGR03067 family)
MSACPRCGKSVSAWSRDLASGLCPECMQAKASEEAQGQTGNQAETEAKRQEAAKTIEKLQKLRDEGALTDEEFKQLEAVRKSTAAGMPSATKKVLAVLGALVVAALGIGKLIQGCQERGELAELRRKNAELERRDSPLFKMWGHVSDVKTGMSAAEAEAIMGPAKKATRRGIEYLGWDHEGGKLYVQLVEGKVFRKGRSPEFPPLTPTEDVPKESREYAVQQELEALEGAWTLVSEERDGQKQASEDPTRVLTFRGDGWTIQRDGVRQSGEARFVDVRTSPRSLDLIRTREFKKIKELPLTVTNAKQIAYLAIYRIDDDVLHLCQSGPDGSKRPTELKTSAGDGFTCTVWRRK